MMAVDVYTKMLPILFFKDNYSRAICTFFFFLPKHESLVGHSKTCDLLWAVRFLMACLIVRTNDNGFLTIVSIPNN